MFENLGKNVENYEPSNQSSEPLNPSCKNNKESHILGKEMDTFLGIYDNKGKHSLYGNVVTKAKIFM